MSKFLPILIVRDHFKTLRAYGAKRADWLEVLLFFGVPAVCAGVAMTLAKFSPDLANLLATVFSVFSALLLNLLVIVQTASERLVGSAPTTAGDGVSAAAARVNESRRKDRIDYLKEVHANISFGTLVSVVLLGLVLVHVVFSGAGTVGSSDRWDLAGEWGRGALECSIWYLVGIFLLDLFMVLKRIHILLDRTIAPPDDDRKNAV
jgi:hypothetical protein